MTHYTSELSSVGGTGTFTLPTSVPIWKTISDNKYWAYRRFKRSGVKDPDAAGLEQATSSVVALAFFADIDKKESTIEVFSSDKNTPEFLPAVLERLRPSGPGIWQAKLPLSNDERTNSALFQLFYYLGFGLAL